MLQIAAEISVNIQVALVDRRDEGQVVHVFQDRPVRRVLDLAVGVAEGEAEDRLPIPPVGHFLDGEVEFIARGEIDDRRGFEGPWASTAALAPINPAFSPGFAALSAAIVFTSEAKEGVDVCSTTKSKFLASATTSARDVRWGGASISLLSGTSAAGCASQVGYQNDLISRFVWYRGRRRRRTRQRRAPEETASASPHRLSIPC